MKKVLVLGGSHSDIPLIESYILSGFAVITTGNRPDHPAHWMAHKYIPGDFSNFDAMLDIAIKEKIDVVASGANDFAFVTASLIAERLGLPGYDPSDVVLQLHHKDQFKQLASKLGMSVCRYEIIDVPAQGLKSLKVSLNFPLVVKPINLTGGKGMTLAASLADLDSALSFAVASSQNSRLVLEEWFPGTLHSYSTYVRNGKIVFEYFDTELCKYQDFLVSTSMSICSVTTSVAKSIRDATQSLVDELRLVDGVLHCQFLFNGSEYRILEYTRRMSGDLYSRVVQLVKGFRHSDLFVFPMLGGKTPELWNEPNATFPWVARHCVTARHAGFFTGVIVENGLRPYILSITQHMPFGGYLAADGRAKVATVILVFPTEAVMTRVISTIDDFCFCDVSENKNLFTNDN